MLRRQTLLLHSPLHRAALSDAAVSDFVKCDFSRLRSTQRRALTIGDVLSKQGVTACVTHLLRSRH